MSRIDEADDPRRRLLIKGLAAGLFAATVPDREALAWDIFGTVPQKLPLGQSIYSLRGTVLINEKQATFKTVIKPNDTIVTKEDSEAIFVVGGHSMIMRENSHLKMEGQDSNFLIQGLRMLAGKLLTVSRSEGTLIKTSTATIGIRGTGYYIESDPERTYFCTCYGITDVESTQDPTSSERIVSKHHDNPYYILSGEPEGKNVRPAPFINHTDQELKLIETLVGRVPPFVFAGTEYTAPRRGY
jgi:hypothetical protein